jgi:hypothetical protein
MERESVSRFRQRSALVKRISADRLVLFDSNPVCEGGRKSNLNRKEFRQQRIKHLSLSDESGHGLSVSGCPLRAKSGHAPIAVATISEIDSSARRERR